MNVKHLFPIFQHHPDLIYLDSAATAQKPKAVIEALTNFYEKDYATVHRAAYSHALRASNQYYASREAVRDFIHAKSAEEIVFTRGTTEALNLVARCFALEKIREGDEIILSRAEHHSNLIPWQMIARQKKAVLKWIPVDEKGGLDLKCYESLFSKRTKMVAVAHISNVTGSIHPIEEIIHIARRKGAWVVVDGAQAAPHQELDMQALDVDFYAFSSHKCYGPTGVGVLYGKESLLAEMEPLYGGGDMVLSAHWEESSYQSPPLRFEAGTPNIASIIAFKSAITFLQVQDRKKVAAWEQHLLQRATQQLLAMDGVQIVGTAPEKAPILTFAIEGVHPLDLNMYLDLKRIAIRSGHLCAQPLLRHFGYETVSRASFGMYNTEEDIDLFTHYVGEAVQQLRRNLFV